MIKQELKRLSNNPNFSDQFSKSITTLKSLGVFDILFKLGQPEFVFEGKDQAAMASQAARSYGWNEAINSLINLEAIIEAALVPTTTPKMRYQGLDAAVKRGDILKEEQYAIEHGLTIDATTYKPKPTATS